MHITIHLFAGLADRLGTSTLQLDIPTTTLTVNELKEFLYTAYPSATSQLQVSFVAVNQEYALPERPIHSSDEIALIPPVSGGEETAEQHHNVTEHATEDGMYVITSNPLQVDQVTSKVIHRNHGATLSFVGTTREMTGEQKTIHLEYEAYIPMALTALQNIGLEVHHKWPGTLCAISHRIGVVHVSEISVIIAVSSPHRDACYEASRYAIERLKNTVPIWKKEIWDNGSTWLGYQQGPWNPLEPN
ncbi:molybdopterin synthase catalytic subunit [Paenibacillus shirakamiensis]|uniref:Molybdopterin synthase catalytic subunit n=1 Tax=Paenibacillus shirakamiensis TaxID=1265935 RepID=A0ABS4JLJ5_9BACL|nr:molybdopterin converting factor subunit 1 [Paenibacillus shirakamiensis]MBP2002582.1 molybdopterin synthase catalytic subunit [Paenibacillus shirakamiensis]